MAANRNLQLFDDAVAKLLKDLERATTLNTISLALGIRGRLARATPVRSGRAAASWNLSAGDPDLSYKPEGYFNPIGCFEDGNISLAAYRPGTTLYITNAIPYIRRLNDGYSVQNAPGWIDRVLAEVEIGADRVMNDIHPEGYLGAVLL
jgi:hypothetical protein